MDDLDCHAGSAAGTPANGVGGRDFHDQIRGVAAATPGSTVRVSARKSDQDTIEFDTVCRLDSDTDVEYLRNGGILPLVLRQLMGD